ncbi:hypothetical protein GCM10009841_10670 [Microlunatus panaciterrae]|uniref:tRNA threonylcarbamoyladenosine biosynthesis protein TsaE n=1 Tax=Microlunatus panaciterrae TaxID=400768 RepID=A0ABS2RKU7_9ACTN|nr:tRNA (adenosine(37)-N6)-threonylcarbamoyltransferase complex ATPase subunit type 1 TsaE [Microlunatus panaciterrae]MBM7799626.1 tRNA threonylcarbamoyladenosine biosynthesis protein TsaE [Microlunatus panaciterrae]
MVNVSVIDLVLSVASPADATGMVEVIHAAFGARPPLDPPSTAIAETPASIRTALSHGGGVFATVDGRPAGVILVLPGPEGARGRTASLQRVSVHPEFQRHGVASTMVHGVEEYAAELGYSRLELFARSEFAELIAFWQHRGFTIDRAVEHGVILAKDLPLCVAIPDSEAMQAFGERLAGLLRPGDLIIASGDLGAGKTTLTQGIGRGLGSDGPIISPTFVISRVHRSEAGRPALVHVDAYRLGGPDELEDLDLDASLADSVTVVEWGEGMAEALSDSRLEIDIRRSQHEDDECRTLFLRPIGDRWHDVDLEPLRHLDLKELDGHDRSRH